MHVCVSKHVWVLLLSHSTNLSASLFCLFCNLLNPKADKIIRVGIKLQPLFPIITILSELVQLWWHITRIVDVTHGRWQRGAMQDLLRTLLGALVVIGIDNILHTNCKKKARSKYPPH